MENDMELISSPAATLFQHFTSRDSEDHEGDNDMVETREQISYPAVVSQHFTSWDSDDNESETTMVDAPQKIPLSEYLQIIGWNFYSSHANQHLKAGRTPGPHNKFPSFDSSYIPVIRNQMSPAAESQLLIDIDAAHEKWLQRKAETFAEKLNRIQLNKINIAAGHEKWFQSQRLTSVAANSASEVEMHRVDIDAVYKKLLPSQRRMHKVSRQLRMKEEQQHSGPSVYDPIMVSLGPYHHHGKEEFRQAEEFKYLCLHWCADGSEENKGRFLNLILGVIDRVRRSYAEISIVNLYDDDALALMMLLDACFIINFMKIRVSNEIAKDTYNCLGVAGAIPFAARDIMVLENQIPFFVLELLLSGIYGQEGETILEEFLSGLMSLELDRVVIPRQDKDPPIHILEACRRVLVEKHSTTLQDEKREPDSCETTRAWIGTMKEPGKKTSNASKENTIYASSKDKNSSYNIICPSITHLKSKGIHFRPSSQSLNDIEFSSHAFYGLLQLPVCHVSDLTVVFLSNMIAHEIAPDNVIVSPDLEVLSYTNFMKALIQTPADVLELQQKGILRINRFANQEQVVKLFQSIDTFNLRNAAIYQDVMIRVGEYCNSKAKTWMADLIHGKLNSPWTIIALFSATILLILTFLQTFFTIHPAR